MFAENDSVSFYVKELNWELATYVGFEFYL